MGLAQVGGVDGRETLGEGGLDLARVDQARHGIEDMVLLDHVCGLEAGTGEHELPGEGCTLALYREHDPEAQTVCLCK